MTSTSAASSSAASPSAASPNAVFAVDRASVYTPAETERVQRRTVVVLLASQAAGGFGLVATYIVSALLAEDITGSSTLATIAASSLSIGSATVAAPMSKLMNKYGRRAGLRFGYLVGAVGATMAVLGAILLSFPLLCLGVFGAGAGNAANLATRYAASDLATENRRASTIAMIVWATTFGSYTGSVVSGYASDIGVSLGLPDKTGSYVFAGVMFLLAAAIVETFLRPDPLHLANALAAERAANGTATDEAKPTVREAISLIMQSNQARLAVFAMIVSQVTMVGVMALTPLHMNAGDQSQNVIGHMMGFHILGMYLFSPLVGRLTDSLGKYPMLALAGGLCTWGAMWAAVTTPDGVLGVFMGNFLIGLGWCCGVVAASSLLVELFPIHQRVSVQGVGDFAMLGAGALAGLSSGALYETFQYRGVNYVNAMFGIALALATFVTYRTFRSHKAPREQRSQGAKVTGLTGAQKELTQRAGSR